MMLEFKFIRPLYITGGGPQATLYFENLDNNQKETVKMGNTDFDMMKKMCYIADAVIEIITYPNQLPYIQDVVFLDPEIAKVVRGEL